MAANTITIIHIFTHETTLYRQINRFLAYFNENLSLICFLE